ncbi:MAG: hypothetical protein ATN31_00305 [Candidatus Epulonipiscioides saccharophilum]|nr:MAG: hypothetical protein ATN31_00305 [Epulopiscium sp. AS2M-Bin001]
MDYNYEALNEYFKLMNEKKMKSEDFVTWYQFGPGTAGDTENVFIHPTDPNYVYNFPDMQNSYISKNGGQTYQSVIDYDESERFGQPVRLYALDFSRQDENFGIGGGMNFWKTNTKGESFEKLGGVDLPISAIAVDPNDDNIWYVGSGNFWISKKNPRDYTHPHGVSPNNPGKLWKSVDKGETFTLLKNTGIDPRAEFGKIVVYPKNSNIVLVNTTYGLYKSVDGAKSFIKLENLEDKTGEDTNLVRDFDLYSSDKDGSIIYAIRQARYILDELNKTVISDIAILKSTDLGESWQNVTGDLGIDLKEIDRINKKVFAEEESRVNRDFVPIWYFSPGRAMGKYFKDVEEFSKKYPNLPELYIHNFSKIAIDPTNPDRVYIMHNAEHEISMFIGDIWMTENGGKNWSVSTRTGTGWQANKEYWDKRNQPTNVNVESQHYGDIYHGELYTRQGARDLDIDKNGNVYVMYRTFIKSTDHGKTWKNIDSIRTAEGNYVGLGNSNLPGRYIVTDQRIPDKMYLLSGENRLFVREEGGEKYLKNGVAVRNIINSPESAAWVSISPHDEKLMYMCIFRQEHNGEFFRSTDGGENWNAISRIFDIPEDNKIYWRAFIKTIIVDPIDPNVIYFAMSGVPIAEPGGPQLLGDLYGVWKSTDAGYNWARVNNGLPHLPSIFNVAFMPDNRTLLASSTAGRPVSIHSAQLNTLDGWSVSNIADVSIVTNILKNAARITNGASITQTVTGLLPNTKYCLSVITRACANSVGELIVMNPETREIDSVIEFANERLDTTSLFFTTAVDQTSVVIGSRVKSGVILVDNFTLRPAGGLFESTDQGQHWYPVSSFPEVAQVLRIMVDKGSGEIFVTAGDFASEAKLGGIWRSQDNCATWQKIFEMPIVIEIARDPYNKNRMLTIVRDNFSKYDCFNSGIYLTEDNAKTWHKINKDFGNATQAFDVSFDPAPNNENIIWATSSGGGFYKGIISR